MSLTSYLAAPSRDWNHALYSAGQRISVIDKMLQGKFCIHLKIMFFFGPQ